MSGVAIVTDSNSGITQEEAKRLGIFVLPMPFYIDGELFYEDITLTQEKFYERLTQDADYFYFAAFAGRCAGYMGESTLEEYDEVVHIPMSSGLSSSCATAQMLAQDMDGKVYVVDNQRISVTMRQSVLDAIALAEKGMNAKEIHDILMREKLEASIYITVDTLKYLKKGGRVTPAAALSGSVLNLKPVLTIQGEKLDSFSKSRGWKSAKKTMLDAMEKDLTERFAGQEMYLQVAYTCSAEEAEEWKAEVENRFPEYEVHMDPLSLSVACHIGHGARAIACSRKVPELS